MQRLDRQNVIAVFRFSGIKTQPFCGKTLSGNITYWGHFQVRLCNCFFIDAGNSVSPIFFVGHVRQKILHSHIIWLSVRFEQYTG